MLANFSNEPPVVPKATVLGIAEEISESLVDNINAGCKSDADSPNKPRRRKKNEALYNKLQKGKLDHLSHDDRQLIEPVLLNYAHLFHNKETNDLPGTNVFQHEELVGDASPIRRPPYRTPYALRGEMKSQKKIMLEKGIIRQSNSPWFAPVILVPKKSPDGRPKFRFCADFRALKAVTKFGPYPLPVFEETTSLFGSKYLFVLDCYSGFWQVAIEEDQKEPLVLQFLSEIMSSIGCLLDFPMAPLISKGL